MNGDKSCCYKNKKFPLFGMGMKFCSLNVLPVCHLLSHIKKKAWTRFQTGFQMYVALLDMYDK